MFKGIKKYNNTLGLKMTAKRFMNRNHLMTDMFK